MDRKLRFVKNRRKTHMWQGENSSWQKELPVSKKKWWFGITPKTKVFFLMTPPKGCHWSDRPTWCHRPWRSITKRWPDDLHLLGCKQKNAHCLKITQNVSHIFFVFTNFCPIKSDLSANTVWPLASSFRKKIAEMDHFWHF